MKNLVNALVLIGVVTVACAYEICGPGESGTFHRDYSTCQSYIACSEGKSYPGVCPKDYLFNPVKSSCDFPHNVNCNLSCPTTGFTAFSLNKSCLKYVQCNSGKATYEECERGKIFDSKTKQCQPREKANCPSGGKCPDPRVEYSWASEEKCEGYFSCKKGKYSVNECRGGLHYNSAKQVCDTKANAKCPIITTKEVEFKDVQIVCPQNGTEFYPHVLDCTSYYICWNGKATLLACNNGLQYDYIRKVCDVKSKVKCVADILRQSAALSNANKTPSTSVKNKGTNVASSAVGNNVAPATNGEKEKEKEKEKDNKKQKKSNDAKQ